jgi:hypothetical protein
MSSKVNIKRRGKVQKICAAPQAIFCTFGGSTTTGFTVEQESKKVEEIACC